VKARKPEHRLGFRVRGYEVDPGGRLGPTTLCRWLQEAAAEHAAALGVAVETLIEAGVAWVLTRFDLAMDRWPVDGDEVIVATWPEAMNRLLTERRFEITGSGGEPFGRATTLWLVLDLASRRPVRIPSSVSRALASHGLGAHPVRPADLAGPQTVERELRFDVRRSDLDLAGHVNNTSFVEWALEAVPEEIWAGSELRRLEVAFLAECRSGQSVVTRAGRESGGAGFTFCHQVVRPDDDREVARARSRWSSPAARVLG
jgi:acyl-ACP thioesterase